LAIACSEEVAPRALGTQGDGDESEDPTVVPSSSEAEIDPEAEEPEQGPTIGAEETRGDTRRGAGALRDDRVPLLPFRILAGAEGLAGGKAGPAGAGAVHAPEEPSGP